jgi:hypothetical protein
MMPGHYLLSITVSPYTVNIFEYFKTPHPWFNTVDYTIPQIVLFTAGAVLWVVAYINTLVWIKKRQVLDIPAIAIVLNYTCEITTGFFFLPNMGTVLVIAYWAWMVLDTFIVISLFRYGYKQMRVDYFKRHIAPLLVIGLIVCFAVQCSFIVSYDLPMAPLDSYIINLVMSVCFIYMYFIPGYEGNRKLTGWTKFLGTGLISIMFQTKYPDNFFLTSLYISCAFFDILYLYLLHKESPPIAV